MTTSTLHRRGMGKGLHHVMNHCITPEDISKDCKLLLLPGNTETKEKNEKKKKEREKRRQTNGSKKRGYSSSTPQNSADTEKKPQTTSLPNKSSPSTPAPQGGSGAQMTKVKVQARGESCGRGSRKLKDAVTASSGSGQKNTPGEAPSSQEGGVVELSAQAVESLRWEGVLEDPVAEERRMEVYRANRRQRYLAQRRALVVGAQGDLILRKQQEQGRPKEDKEAVALPGQDQ